MAKSLVKWALFPKNICKLKVQTNAVKKKEKDAEKFQKKVEKKTMGEVQNNALKKKKKDPKKVEKKNKNRKKKSIY